MDVDDPIEIRIGSNLDDFVRGMDAAEARMYSFKTKMETLNIPSLDQMMGMGSMESGKAFGSSFAAQADLMLGAAGRMGQAAKITQSAYTDLDRMLGGSAPATFVNQFAAHANELVGAASKMAGAAVTATHARMSLDEALGMGGTRPHSDPHGINNNGPRSHPTAGGSLDNLLGMNGPARAPAGGYAPGERERLHRLQNYHGSGRPDVFGADYRRDRHGGRGRPPGGGGEEEGGFQWDWMSSIIGGIGGRTIGGHLAGLGGMFGGGVGGPVGAIAGAGFGMAIHAVTAALDVMKDVGIAAFHGIARASGWALQEVIKLGMEYERRLTTFQVMTGSKEAGNKLLGDITQLGINSPYTTRDLAGQGEVLLGYGQDKSQIVPTLGRLGDIAGGDPERLRRLTLAFGQVLSHGRFQGQELRQFAEAGIGSGDFAQTLGMSGSEFKKGMHNGDIDANAMIATINRLTSPGGRFSGSSAAQMQTVGGAWSNIVERAELAGGQLGLGMFKELDVANNINAAADALGELTKHGNEVVDWLGRANKELDPFKTALHAMRDETADVFSGLFDSAPKWSELGGTMNKWATETTATFLTLEQGIRAIPDALQGVIDTAEVMSGLGLIGKASKAMGGPGTGSILGQIARFTTPAGLIGGFFMDEMEDIQDINRDSAKQMMKTAGDNRKANKWGGLSFDMARRFMFGLSGAIPNSAIALHAMEGKIGFDPDVKRFGDSANTKWENGDRFHPLERYEHKLGLIDKMFDNSPDSRKKLPFGVRSALSELVGGLGQTHSDGEGLAKAFGEGPGAGLSVAGQVSGIALGAALRQVGILGKGGDAQRDRLRLDAYQELERTVGHGNFDVGIAREGSSDAIDTINRSMMLQGSVFEKVLAVMEAAKQLQEQQKDIEEKQLDALNQLEAKGL